MSTKTATDRDNQELAQLLAIKPMHEKKVAALDTSALPAKEKDRIRKGSDAIDKRIAELQAKGATVKPPG